MRGEPSARLVVGIVATDGGNSLRLGIFSLVAGGQFKPLVLSSGGLWE
jgi:hypothetical protein